MDARSLPAGEGRREGTERLQHGSQGARPRGSSTHNGSWGGGGLMGAWPQVTCTQSPGGPQAERGPMENLTLSLAAALSLTQTC